MDNFENYLKKKRSELFFFIKNCTLAVLRFSNRCEIVDMVTGEVLTTLKVNAVSEVVYCEKHDKLFMKSISKQQNIILYMRQIKIVSLLKNGREADIMKSSMPIRRATFRTACFLNLKHTAAVMPRTAAFNAMKG